MSKNELSLPKGNFLGTLLNSAPPATTIEPETGGSFVPYVAFYSGREGNRGGSLTARDIADALPGISVGTPYYRNGDALGFVGTVVLLDLFTFYGRRDSDNAWASASKTKEAKTKEAAIALLFLIDGDQVIPAICETLGKAKSSALFKVAADMQKAKTRAIQARISGAAKSFTNDDGETIEYTQTYAKTTPVDAEVTAKLAKFGADPANEELLIAAQAEFARRRDEVVELF